MSGFERSLLEGKERDELTKIAEQLGRKPPSRARKAEIVDLILELAGVNADGTPADGSDATAGGPETDGGGDTRGGNADAARSGRPGGSEAGEGRGDQSGSGGSRGDTEDAGTGAGSGPGGGGAEAGSDRSTKGGGGSAKGGGGSVKGGGGSAKGDGGSSKGEGGSNKGENRSARGEGGPGADSGGEGQGIEEAEPGNRRRRRRGRGGDKSGADEAAQSEPVDVAGTLDLRDDGYGFLRVTTLKPSRDDVYVSVKQARQFGLRKGDLVAGKSRAATRNEKNPALLQIDAVNHGPPEEARKRPRFDDLTPTAPDRPLWLERPDDPGELTTRIIDLVAPIGRGQRALVAAPPRSGKTALLREVVRSIEANDPDTAVIVLLVDERPEEVTEMRRWLTTGEVVASTFDRPADEHTTVAELVTERARRMLESGTDVVLVLDGLTRLTRAYNAIAPGNGRILPGGLDAGALHPPKRIFGAARSTEEAGSLTMIATLAVETGSATDDAIFEEFTGTANAEIRLDRIAAGRGLFPTIDPLASSTRHPERLLGDERADRLAALRARVEAVADGAPLAGLEMLIDRARATESNDALLDGLPAPGS